MNLKINRLINNLEDMCSGKPWYGTSFGAILNQIDVEIVNTSVASANSVARLIQHLINWRVFALEKGNGNADFDIELNTPADWTAIVITSEADWGTLKTRFWETQTALIELLHTKEDDFLSQQVAGYDYDFQHLFEGIIQHDIYHLGQIALVAKQAQLLRMGS